MLNSLKCISNRSEGGSCCAVVRDKKRNLFGTIHNHPRSRPGSADIKEIPKGKVMVLGIGKRFELMELDQLLHDQNIEFVKWFHQNDGKHIHPERMDMTNYRGFGCAYDILQQVDIGKNPKFF